ncbi:hypothetical protein ABBQ38_009634 [Trebouxia sp. C0009 RCD-2024]
MGRSSASACNTVKKCNSQKILSGRTSLQTLAELCSLPLSVYVCEGSFWIAVHEQVAATLREYALGSSDGGPLTAVHTANKLIRLTGTSPTSSQTDALVSLRLSPEEAIFLALAAGNVHFYHVTTGLRSLEDTWHSCVSGSSSFVHKYIAYHHYRSKGWIPRSGLQYGTDLVLYEEHPSLVHSTMCVIIVATAPPASHTDQISSSTSHGTDGALPWHDVEGINRLCIRVPPCPCMPCIALNVSHAESSHAFTHCCCLSIRV